MVSIPDILVEDHDVYGTDENEVRILYEYLAEASVVFPKVIIIQCSTMLFSAFQLIIKGQRGPWLRNIDEYS